MLLNARVFACLACVEHSLPSQILKKVNQTNHCM